MIFCLPVIGVSSVTSRLQTSILTVAAGLHRRLNVTDALHRNSVLVVSVHVLVFELADFVEQHTKLVGDVRDIFVAGLAPDGELLLSRSVLHPV